MPSERIGGSRIHQDDGDPRNKPITTPESCQAWACIAEVLFIAVVVICLCAAFIQIVLPPFYR